jgi:Flp pilus assembly protein TadB
VRRFNRWLLVAPLYVHFAVSALTFGLITYGFDAALSDRRDSWLEHFIGGVAYGALMTGMVAWRRRKDGGASQQQAFVTAVKSGELPADADPEVWAPLLDRKQRSIRRARPWAIGVFTAFTALAVVLAVGKNPVWWLFAALFAAMGVWLVVVGRRNARRIDGLRAQLPHEQQHPA